METLPHIIISLHRHRSRDEHVRCCGGGGTPRPQPRARARRAATAHALSGGLRENGAGAQMTAAAPVVAPEEPVSAAGVLACAEGTASGAVATIDGTASPWIGFDFASGGIFPCPLADCNNIFARRYNLSVHMRKHTGETPYTCLIPGCGDKFTWRSETLDHSKIHESQGLKEERHHVNLTSSSTGSFTSSGLGDDSCDSESHDSVASLDFLARTSLARS